jgi:hypothetical protein
MRSREVVVSIEQDVGSVRKMRRVESRRDAG